jgi:arginyl-tRNA synthetase
MQSIIDHAGMIKKTANNEKLLILEEEFNLVKILSEFESTVIQSQKELAPHIICRYLMRLCSLMNSYYANVKILKSEEPLRSARITLLKKSIEVLKKSMNLIGMEFLERM